MKPKLFNLRFIVTLIAFLTLVVPTGKLKAQSTGPLCFTAPNGNATVKFTLRSGFTGTTIMYSTDDTTWNNYSLGTPITLSNAGDKIYFKAASDHTTAFGAEGDYSHFSFSDSVEASGNIMSLFGPDYSNNKTVPVDAFNSLFSNCTTLTKAPELPATTLAYRCYFEMFYGCTALTSAPALPATTLAQRCYCEMFYGCTALTSAPELPATSLALFCYDKMFYECTSLTSAPELPATTLEGGCYWEMFKGCTSLTSAPVLPATTLEKRCYDEMFANCSSLVATPELPATTLAENCYHQMFYNCTTLTSVPELPATTLADYCYQEMFKNCKGIKINTSAPGKKWSIPATSTVGDALKDMLKKTSGTMNGTPQCNTTYYIASDPSNKPLTFTAKGGSVNVTFTLRSGFTDTIQYSTDGTTWTDCTQPTTTASATTNISLNQNGSVYFRAKSDHTTEFGVSGTSQCSYFSFSDSVEASGNIMSLFWTDYANKSTVPATDYAFKKLFNNCTTLTKAPELPATTLADECYQEMFYGCTGLTAAPELPATTLADECYESMFEGCTSLTSVPALPATTLAKRCYYQMFNGCTSLTSAPALPATTLTDKCYKGMFDGCSSLTSAPALPATTLADECYERMFYGCTALASAPALPATTLAVYCYSNMFYGCTALTSAPALPATTLAQSCYSEMFNGCTKLTSAPELPATTLAQSCYSEMFKGCTALTSAPELSATEMASHCYALMFNGCTSLKTAPELPATTLAEDCYYQMFANCSSLVATSELPATTLANYCYYGMFLNCTTLTSVPELPAATLANYCYNEMFNGCSSLIINTNAPGKEWSIRATSTSTTTDALTNMFAGTSGTMNSTPECYTKYYIASDPSYKPLTFTAKGGSVDVTFTLRSGFTDTIQYSTDGTTWTDCTQPTTTASATTTISLAINGSACFRAASDHTTAFGVSGTSQCSFFSFSGSGTVEASGNIMSLFGPDYANKSTVPATDYAFKKLFDNCTTLTKAPELPATTLENGCYESMFEGCTSLTSAPALPATTLAKRCYYQMFNGCTALTSAPVLSATTLKNECYESMFEGCTSLTSAPALPATTLANKCYKGMLYGCTLLTSAPVLPATTLAEECYESMFEGCTLLTSAPELPATTLAFECYGRMFYGCTALTSAPVLPATTLAQNSYLDMFNGCTALTSAPALPATTLADECYESMFEGCTLLTSAPELPATNLATFCYVRMFYGCTALTAAPELFATEMAEDCYALMFDSCTSLKTAPELPATTLATSCYFKMFANCSSLVATPELPATTLAKYCYYGMFLNCTTLTSVPELPAATLADYCYKEMFKNCSTLVVNTTGTAKEWKINAGYLSGALDDMFTGTNGSMNGTPNVSTTYYVAGATKQTIADGNWDNTAIWYDGEIPSDADDVTINHSVTVPNGVSAHCDKVTIGIGSLSVAPLASLHTRVMANSDSTRFIIESDSAGTGTVRFETGSPKATVQMYLKGTTEFDEENNPTPEWQYRGFIGTPDTGQTLTYVVIYKWNESTNKTTCWSQYYDGYVNNSKTGNFEHWIGLSVANFTESAVTPTYTTTLEATNSGHQFTSMTRTGSDGGSTSAPNYGVNLVTNSYSAPINMDAIETTDMVNLEQTFYFFNTCTKSESSSAITTYPLNTGSYTYGTTTNPYIPAGQSFAVKANADNPRLTIPALAVTTVRSKAMYAPRRERDPMVVKITVEGDEAMDELFLLQMEECTSGFDNGYDGTKLFSSKSDQIYATNEYGTTAVNADMTLLGQYIGFKPVSKGTADVTMRISARNYEGYDELYLYDHQTGDYIEITEEEVTYTFSSTGEESQRRFQIVGKADDGTIYEPAAEERIEVAGGEIYLMNFDRTDAQIIMSDASGRIVWSANTNMGNHFTLPELPKGVYFIHCGKATAKYIPF